MGFDRRITLAIRGAGRRNDHDEYIPGPLTNYPVWAELRPVDLERVVQTGGILTLVYGEWRVRYLQALMDAASDLTRVMVVEAAEAFTVRNVIEDTGRNGQDRRKYIIIEGVHA